MDKIKYLSRIQLFHELELEELKKIEPDTPIDVMKRGTIITSPHMEQKFLYLIKSGKVRLYKLSEDGKELTIDILGIGHVFGAVGTFTTGSEGIYAETWEDSLICKIDKIQFEKIIRDRPDIALKFIEIISIRLKEMEELLEHMAYGSARKRLLFLLYKLSKKFGIEVDSTRDWIPLEISITHQELANMMGSIRETVTSLLSDLTKEGIIRRMAPRKPMQIHLLKLMMALDNCEK
ncbi:Crp/Fnr family transcriptional regulator [Bacillus gaemokensis]|uniref:Transcriptional regulator n=1 Tax=Bacillus gaemokensis TaxID=574375 RepID=A0A073KTB3_9BACI|nr:Crp/Fnr family transcriptional regulator [Bacillus gaemokensis]KEK25618.1 transcriptional regulator [Bacillus gaemokensis]KYG36941.1 transcriptional regulator [Bacillus gaemokensis]